MCVHMWLDVCLGSLCWRVSGSAGYNFVHMDGFFLESLGCVIFGPSEVSMCQFGHPLGFFSSRQVPGLQG